jgi:hypothetical protein
MSSSTLNAQIKEKNQSIIKNCEILSQIAKNANKMVDMSKLSASKQIVHDILFLDKIGDDYFLELFYFTFNFILYVII